MAGLFHKMDVSPSCIEKLLNRVDAADAAADDDDEVARECRTEEEIARAPAAAAAEDAVPSSFEPPPTIEDFLAEEDITRECRSDNKRLIAYLCRPEIVAALVGLCINVHAPSFRAAAPTDASSVAAGDGNQKQTQGGVPGEVADHSSSTTAPDPATMMTMQVTTTATAARSISASEATHAYAQVQAPAPVDEDAARREENLRKARYTRSYIASELLSADVRPLADAVVGNDAMIDSLFACLDRAPPGELDTYVGIHFAKIISSLLKTRNEETLAQLSRRSSTFIPGLLKHLALPAIAELIVRILDGPDVDRGYSTVIARPSQAALNLLVTEDVLNGLADRFVACAKPDTVAGNARTESTSARRIREETMYHASLSIQGIVTRILQLPALGVHIPAMLNPYASPGVIMRMLKAGLDAYDLGCSIDSPSSSALSGDPAHASPTTAAAALDYPPITGGTSASTSGCMAALLHALNLAAILMTTDANIVRDDNVVDGMMGGSMVGGVTGNALAQGIQISGRHGMLGMGRGRPGIGYGMVGRGGAGGGIAASIQRQHEEQERSARAAADAERDAAIAAAGGIPDTPEPPVLPEVGCPIESTAFLEAQLVTLFDRLSQMFGSDTNDEAEGRPLGSLRLTLAEFFVACMKKSSERTVAAIVDLGVPKKLTILFLRYEWSSMLHGVITRSIVAAFSGVPSGAPARKAWLNAGLVPWLIEAWALNEAKAEAEELRFRAGYMGHLIQIGHKLLQYTQEFSDECCQEGMFSEEELKIFQQFAEQHLAPAHRIESTPLGGDGGQGTNAATSDGDDVYDVTNEVFDMSEVMDGLTQGEDQNAAISRFSKYIIHRTEDDEEVVPLDVEYADGDLSHFGPDDDDDGEAAAIIPAPDVDVDHDIPVDVRVATSISSTKKSSSAEHNSKAIGRATDRAISGDADWSGQERSVGRDINAPVAASAGQGLFGANDVRIKAGDDLELQEVDVNSAPARSSTVECFDDSSSDDDKGTYQEFVECATGLEEPGVPLSLDHDPIVSDTRQNHGETVSAVSSIRTPVTMTRVSGDQHRGTASVGKNVGDLADADISAARHVKPPPGSRSGASASTALGGVVILDDDEDDSSGDDGEGWTTFPEFADKQTHLKVSGDDASITK